jgi:outer membrane protein assembly factor BamD
MASPGRIKVQHRIWLLGLLAASLVLASCGRRATAAAGDDAAAEPDKLLYERAMENIQDGKHELGRLTLQTLMNTYPESEYLAKAKLAIADSYYKEGSTSGLLQSVAEYQDFITFFPFLDEAAYAQMQIGMAHYRRMEKPDRDRTEAMAAESAFQSLLQKYPDGPMAAEAQQRLREVQEVLAEGEFRIANFYFIRRADRAASVRLTRLIDRYPLYSQADRAIWALATTYERNEGGQDLASENYARIIKDYPLSPLVGASTEKLQKLGVPVPQPDSEALARMQQEAQMPRRRPGLLGRSLGMLRTGPDVSMAARAGTPTMAPADDGSQDTLTPGIPLGTNRAGSSPAGAGSGTGVSVETVTPGQRPPAP